MIPKFRLPYLRHAIIAAAAGGVLTAFIPQVVSAQMMDSYRFQARDRASIAFGMREVENRQTPQQVTGAGGGGGGAGSLTQLVCGSGEGGSTAAGSTANSSCLILNNVTGSVGVGQDSAGDQNANANSQSPSSVSETIEDLAGE